MGILYIPYKNINYVTFPKSNLTMYIKDLQNLSPFDLAIPVLQCVIRM